MPNMEELAKRLLALGQYGCHLEGQDGHIWIEPSRFFEDASDYTDLHEILKQAGISLNNKIYGGVLQALDTVDEALRLAGQPSLLAGFPGWEYNEPFFFGEPGIGSGRITVEERGEGAYVKKTSLDVCSASDQL